MHEQFPLEVEKATTSITTSQYGVEPHINSGVHIRGNRHHVKHSCRSDASDRIVGISYTSLLQRTPL
eukprot:4456118-Pleurochrysis_carterae.AAC.5